MTVRPSAFSSRRLSKSSSTSCGHEHRGRLVEDQDPRAAVEDLEDLHPLPVADAQLLDQHVGVDARARSASRHLLDRARGRVAADAVQLGSAPSTMFSSTVRLSASMKCWCTMPMPRAMASAGLCRMTCSPSTRDGALVRPLHAVEDLHQRRLARAVLADDRVHGARARR